MKGCKPATIQILNPLEISSWDQSLLKSGDDSFFHTSSWASVLHRTYGYKPAYFVASENEQLVLVMPFMQVASIFTGRRGVSLPFSDHCAPHFSKEEYLLQAMQEAFRYGELAGWRYIEWRHSDYGVKGAVPWNACYTHDIDLQKSEEDLFCSLKSSNQRNIHKARREGVEIRISDSEDSLRVFFRLHCLTRKRHGVPPQPSTFFKNLYLFVMAKGYGIVVSAWYRHKIIAASVYFHFGKNAVFKYGASDLKFQNLRANDLVMWEAIKYYESRGFNVLNLGRTEDKDSGLMRFKRGWGALESQIAYYHFDFKRREFLRQPHKRLSPVPRILSFFPVNLLRLIGSFSYKHFG